MIVPKAWVNIVSLFYSKHCHRSGGFKQRATCSCSGQIGSVRFICSVPVHKRKSSRRSSQKRVMLWDKKKKEKRNKANDGNNFIYIHRESRDDSRGKCAQCIMGGCPTIQAYGSIKGRFRAAQTRPNHVMCQKEKPSLKTVGPASGRLPNSFWELVSWERSLIAGPPVPPPFGLCKYDWEQCALSLRCDWDLLAFKEEARG